MEEGISAPNMCLHNLAIYFPPETDKEGKVLSYFSYVNSARAARFVSGSICILKKKLLTTIYY